MTDQGLNLAGSAMLIVNTVDFRAYPSKSRELVVCRGVKVSRYLEPEARQGIGIPGQPRPQYYSTAPCPCY